MLTTNDIGNLFQSMRTTYGAQWKHSTDSMGVWREALKQYTPQEVEQACVDCLRCHVDHPPTLPQFIQLIDPPNEMIPRANTYLPPPEISPQTAIGNKMMLQILNNFGGVDIDTLREMVRFRRSLETGEKPDMTFLEKLEEGLTELADGCDKEKRREEKHRAWEAFCVAQGIPMPEVPPEFS